MITKTVIFRGLMDNASTLTNTLYIVQQPEKDGYSSRGLYSSHSQRLPSG